MCSFPFAMREPLVVQGVYKYLVFEKETTDFVFFKIRLALVGPLVLISGSRDFSGWGPFSLGPFLVWPVGRLLGLIETFLFFFILNCAITAKM